MLLDSVFELGSTIIDKLFPDKEEAEKRKVELLHLQQAGQLKELETRLSVILAEAKSQDKWTSRARPSFLYVMYIMILGSIPMGGLYAVSPETAHHIATGMKEWLSAVPDFLWGTMGFGYGGYSIARSIDKKGLAEAKRTWLS